MNKTLNCYHGNPCNIDKFITTGNYYSLLRSGQAQPTSTSLRKPSYFDSGKYVNVGTEDGLCFDPCFDSINL